MKNKIKKQMDLWIDGYKMGITGLDEAREVSRELQKVLYKMYFYELISENVYYNCLDTLQEYNAYILKETFIIKD